MFGLGQRRDDNHEVYPHPYPPPRRVVEIRPSSREMFTVGVIFGVLLSAAVVRFLYLYGYVLIP